MNKKKGNNINHYINNGGSKINTEKTGSNLFRANNKNITKKGEFKKSLTINKMYKFRAADILEKKLGNSRAKKDKY